MNPPGASDHQAGTATPAGPSVDGPGLTGLLRQAQAQGLLPGTATLPTDTGRPWPVLLLTALGAWLAVLPLLVAVGMLFGDWLDQPTGPYLVGSLLLAAAVVVLRAQGLSLFVEQLALPALLLGGAAMGVGLFRDLEFSAAAGALTALTLALAAVVPAAWLRTLLGAAAAAGVAVTWAPVHATPAHPGALVGWWWCWHGVAAAWLLQLALLSRGLPPARALGLEALATGWGVASLLGLAAWAGQSFLVGGVLGGGVLGELGRGLGTAAAATPVAWGVLRSGSGLLALAAAGWLWRCWPALRHPALAGAALVLVGMAALMPSLGAVLLLLAVAATSARWRLAVLAGVAAVWVVGAFYHQLAWPLAHKALALAAAGALLALLAAWARHRPLAAQAAAAGPAAAATGPGRAGQLAIAASLLAVLAVAVVGIREKEALIRDGRPVFIELAPADPRSLMQGDFMRLNVVVPGEPEERRAGLLRRQRPQVVGRLDDRGVATLLRIDDGRPLAPGELRIELTPKDGRWIVVSDAWFFAEGEAERWARARYGEYRVADDGRALLVGLRGAGLEPL